MFSTNSSRIVGRAQLRTAGALLAAVATIAIAAVSSAPAQAATNNCYARGVGYSSAPFSATMSGTICNNGSGGSCPAGVNVSTSIPFWASPFVTVTGITKGCYYLPDSYGGAESMWSNISIKITEPLEPWVTVAGTVWLRIAVTHNGTTYTQAGATENLFASL